MIEVVVDNHERLEVCEHSNLGRQFRQIVLRQVQEGQVSQRANIRGQPLQLVLVQVEFLQEGVFEKIERETFETLTAEINRVEFALWLGWQLYPLPCIVILFFLSAGRS